MNRSRSSRSLVALSLGALLVLARGSNADAAEATPHAGAGPCRQDVAKFCADAAAGQEKHKCMRAHLAELSAECKSFVAERGQKFKAAREACAGDAKKLCADAEHGGGHIASCLHEHAADLSPDCKSALAH